MLRNPTEIYYFKKTYKSCVEGGVQGDAEGGVVSDETCKVNNIMWNVVQEVGMGAGAEGGVESDETREVYNIMHCGVI